MSGPAIHEPVHHGLWTPAARRLAGRLLAGVFIAVVGVLIFEHARKVDWGAVREGVTAYPAGTLAVALALVVASHLTYAAYELLARRYVGHQVSTPQSLGVGLVSYAFNLNFGSLVGGVGFRLRLYSRLGLARGQVARLIVFSMVTNWSGYFVLAGLVLATRTVQLPASLAVGDDLLQGIGFAMLAAAAVYVRLCAASKKRVWRLRHHHFELPSGRMALAQIAISALNWSLIGGTVWVLLPAGPSFFETLGTLLGAAIAAVPTHVPGGLGVLEAVFVGVLSPAVEEHALIAALLVYRALYYLLPLAVAALLYLGFETRARQRSRRAARAAP